MKNACKLLLILFLGACGAPSENQQTLSPQNFDKKIKSTPDAIVLDVRTPEEVSQGIIEGAINIVYDESFGDKIKDLKHQPIFIYCAGGKRSAKAAKILRENGYTDVYELEGGMNNWEAAGMPVSK